MWCSLSPPPIATSGGTPTRTASTPTAPSGSTSASAAGSPTASGPRRPDARSGGAPPPTPLRPRPPGGGAPGPGRGGPLLLRGAAGRAGGQPGVGYARAAGAHPPPARGSTAVPAEPDPAGPAPPAG